MTNVIKIVIGVFLVVFGGLNLSTQSPVILLAPEVQSFQQGFAPMAGLILILLGIYFIYRGIKD